MSLLALVVRLIHIAFVVYLVLYPFLIDYYCYRCSFQEKTLFHLLYLMVCVSLLVHWFFNDDTCFLTLVESRLSGKPISEGFIYSIVSPVYKFPDQGELTKMSYALVLVNMLIVLFKATRI